MLRFSSPLLAFIAGFLLSIAPLTHAGKQQLIILNWSDYLEPELISKFETLYDVEVSEVYYRSDDHRTQMLVENNAEGYDLIVLSGIDIDLYARRNWILKLNTELIPNLKHISPQWRTAFKSAEPYSIPYFWGTTGIIYRTDLVSTPLKSWMDIYKPSMELQGKIAMIEDAKDIIGMGLKALGYSANSETPHELKEVENLLLAQQPHVRTYNLISLENKSPVISGEVVAAMMYSGDALMLQEESSDLHYVVPKEGGNIWVDYFAVSTKANNPELAHKFLNFMNEPENAAIQAQSVYYATPNIAAEALLPPEFLSNSIIYPDKNSLQASEFFTSLPPRALRIRNRISAKVLK